MDNDTARAFIFGQILGGILSNQLDNNLIPDFDKVSECFDKGLSPEQTADLIIKNNWWQYDTDKDNSADNLADI